MSADKEKMTAPGMRKKRTAGVLLHPGDQVLTLTEAVHKGDTVFYPAAEGEEEVAAREDIPKYHKIARRPIACGQDVFKYGEVIGRAVKPVYPGEWVHVHNLKSVSAAEREKDENKRV